MTDRATFALAGLLLSLVLAAGGVLLLAPDTAYAETAGTIYVADLNCCGGGGGLIRIDPGDPAGANQTVISSGQNLVSPVAVVLSVDGTLYVVDQVCCGGTGGVIRVDLSQPNGSNQTVISSGQSFLAPTGVALAGDGRLYVTDIACCGGQGGVIRVDPGLPNGSNQIVVSSGQSMSDPYGLTLAPDGTIFVVDFSCCGGGQGGVIQVNPSLPNGANQTIISSGQSFAEPAGIARIGDGTLFVADFICCGGGAVIRVDPDLPVNANQTIIASGPNLVGAVGVTPSADGSLLVATRNCCGSTGGVIRVDRSLPNGSNQTILSSGQSFIDPNGLAVVPGVSIMNAEATEGTGATSAIKFSLSLAPPSSQTIVIPFSTANGSALGGADFTPTSGVATFGPGEVRGFVELQVIGDNLDEPPETFSVTLQPPDGIGTTGATAAGATATGTIVDDDPPASLSISDTHVAEGDNGITSATFTVTLSPASGQIVTVQHTAGSGTAQSGLDFQDASGTLTFQPGETSKNVVVPVIGETTHEPDETFSVTLASPTGGAALGRAQGTGIIRNDDAPPPSLACAPRPNVRTRPVAGGGALQVRVEATPLNTRENNPLREVRFGAFQNARVSLNGQQVASGQTITLPPDTHGLDFTVERISAGQAAMVYFTAVDSCGEFPAFVGGGPSAF